MRAHGILLLGALTTYAVQMLFHEVSYTTLDNSLVFLLAGIAVGLTSPRTTTPEAGETTLAQSASEVAGGRLGPSVIPC